MISQEERVETVQEDAAPKATYRVVVAEADPTMQSLVRDQVAALGHVVIGTARHWSAAIDLGWALLPDLLIISLEMPDPDFDRLRSLIAAHQALTVIGIAYADYQDEAAARQAGVHHYLKRGYK